MKKEHVVSHTLMSGIRSQEVLHSRLSHPPHSLASKTINSHPSNVELHTDAKMMPSSSSVTLALGINKASPATHALAPHI